MTEAALTRRRLLGYATTALAATALAPTFSRASAEPLIDIHQHTHYWGRGDEGLLAHQRALGATKTVLLPAGSIYGLEADCYSNESVLALARRYPHEFVCFANEAPDLPNARRVIEQYLKAGAIGIGEQKFFVESDSQSIIAIAEIARDYGVPVLLHFQHDKYNREFARFHRILDRFPQVNFIGHAQTWWGNIDRAHEQTVLYPTGHITTGGLTDRWLTDYPNLYCDLSAGSGLRALLRDEEFTRAFLQRHQDKLLYGSDCQDADTRSEQCTGIRCLETIRRLSPSPAVTRKILYENAHRVLKLR